MRILLSGIAGHMGKEVEKIALAGYRGATLVCGVDCHPDGTSPVPVYETFDEAPADVDVIVDFSHHANTAALLAFATENRLPLVLATTGQTEEEKGMIADAAKNIPLFFAANYSIGIATLIDLAKRAAKALPDAEIEIVEIHHDRKIDAPSGTALAIADALTEVRPDATVNAGRAGTGKREAGEIGISSVRIGNAVGTHEVLIGTANETITLKHEAHSRALFAEGALAAAEFLAGKPAGLYRMNDMIGKED